MNIFKWQENSLRLSNEGVKWQLEKFHNQEERLTDNLGIIN